MANVVKVIRYCNFSPDSITVLFHLDRDAGTVGKIDGHERLEDDAFAEIAVDGREA
jgi:hypothetical protein